MHARTSAHASFSSRNGNVAIVAGYVQEASTWVTQRHRFYKRIVHRSLTLVGGGNLLPILVGPGTTMEDQRRRDPCIGGVDNTVRNACLQLRCNHKGLIVQNAGSLKRQGFRKLQRRQIHFFSLRITGFDCSTPVVDRRRAFTVSRGTRPRSATGRVFDFLARPRGGRKPPGNGAPLRRHDSARRPAILRRHPVILIGNQTMRSELAAVLVPAVGCESATAVASVAGFESCASRVTCNIRQTRNSSKGFIHSPRR